MPALWAYFLLHKVLSMGPMSSWMSWGDFNPQSTSPKRKQSKVKRREAALTADEVCSISCFQKQSS